MQTVKDIRIQLAEMLKNEDFVVDKNGGKTIEIIGATFVADEDSVFGKVNWDYVDREISWYDSMSRYVKDIPGKTPAIWESVSDKKGKINSNYGWMVFSGENYFQYDHALHELLNNPDTRRAQMIYTRPKIWHEYNANGMSDFICTDAHQYFIRDGLMHVHVRMRSNDLVYGYKNDRAWADYVLTKLVADYNKQTINKVKKGNIIWTAGSAHVYDRHFEFVQDWATENLYR